MKQVLQDPGLKSLSRRNDIFLVDQGFRYAVNCCTEEGYIVLMPALKGEKAQPATEEANMCRHVTKI